MTVYILGGSSASTVRGWADSLVVRAHRKQTIQNLSWDGATSLTALMRLLGEVTLAEGDAVVWATAADDAVSLSKGFGAQSRFLDYVGAMIAQCAAAGARFLPVLIDSSEGHLASSQAGYHAQLGEMLSRCNLDVLDVAQEFAVQMGGAPMPPGNYLPDGLQIAAESDLCAYVRDLVQEFLARGGNLPAASDGPQFAVLGGFEPAARKESVETRSYRVTAWAPPLQLPPGNAGEIEALLVLADPRYGRFTLSAEGAAPLNFSVVHALATSEGRAPLAISLGNLRAGEPPLQAGQGLSVDWSRSRDRLPADLHFAATQPLSQVTESGARVVSVLIRQAEGAQ